VFFLFEKYCSRFLWSKRTKILKIPSKKGVFFNGANFVKPAEFRTNNIFKEKKMHPNSIEVLIQKFEHDRSYRVGKKGKLEIFVQISGFEENSEKVTFFQFFNRSIVFFSNF
jgi:hypothetical protein